MFLVWHADFIGLHGRIRPRLRSRIKKAVIDYVLSIEDSDWDDSNWYIKRIEVLEVSKWSTMEANEYGVHLIWDICHNEGYDTKRRYKVLTLDGVPKTELKEGK